MDKVRQLQRKLFLAVVLASFAGVASAQVSELGEIDFPSSGSEAARPAFLRGVLLLHSFEYEDAAEAFRAAEQEDPDFALAYWGEALTHFHPIWGQEDVEAARAVLERLAPTREERLAKAPTEREKGYLESVEVLFGEGTRDARLHAYSHALERLSERFPADLDARALYALSILGLSYGERDIAAYMRAAAVAEEVYAENPEHPGALHYLIHSYDDPVHAPLGLRMANRYAKVAPAAAHALHMPSHIFVALGLWDRSAASNEDAVAAADARRARKDLSLDARGYHSLWWLAYTCLQQGRVQKARTLLAEVQRDQEAEPSSRKRYHLAVMRAEHLVCAGADEPVLAIEVDTSDLKARTFAGDLLATGLARLARDGSVEALSAAHAKLLARIGEPLASYGTAPSALDCCRVTEGDESDPTSPGRLSAEAMLQEMAALLALEDGDEEGALALLARATEAEVAAGFNFGPPVVVKPTHELQGEVLLALDRPEPARRAFERALERNPRRALSLLGLARACLASEDVEGARAAYTELADVWSHADADLPALAEVHAFLEAER